MMLKHKRFVHFIKHPICSPKSPFLLTFISLVSGFIFYFKEMLLGYTLFFFFHFNTSGFNCFQTQYHKGEMASW